MKYTVYTGRNPVGEISIEACGLYYCIKCKIQPWDGIRRVYSIRGKESVCLGIPDGNGDFERRIPKKRFPEPERIIASCAEPGQWIPWSGDSFGPMIHDGFLKKTNGEWILAVSPDEWETIPQWTDIGKRDMVAGREMIQIDLETADQPPHIEKENGGEENEVHSENHRNAIDPLLLADLPADYDYGGTGEEETHSNYL